MRMPYIFLAYTATYLDHLERGLGMPTWIPAGIRYFHDPIKLLPKEFERDRLDFTKKYLSDLDGENMLQVQAQTAWRICELSLEYDGVSLFREHWRQMNQLAITSRVIELISVESIASLVATFACVWSLEVVHAVNNVGDEIRAHLLWLESLFTCLENIDMNTKRIPPKTEAILEQALSLLPHTKKALLLWMCVTLHPQWLRSLVESAISNSAPATGQAFTDIDREQQFNMLFAEIIHLGLRSRPIIKDHPYLAGTYHILTELTEHGGIPDLFAHIDGSHVGRLYMVYVLVWRGRSTRQTN